MQKNKRFAQKIVTGFFRLSKQGRGAPRPCKNPNKKTLTAFGTLLGLRKNLESLIPKALKERNNPA